MLGKADKNISSDGDELQILVSTDGGTTWVAAKADDEGRLIIKQANSSGTVIDPATEDKQDDVITGLDTLAGYVNEIETNQETAISALDKLVGLEIPAHDYIAVSYDTTVDTVVYKDGGATGTTVATLQVTYTDATKANVASVEKI